MNSQTENAKPLVSVIINNFNYARFLTAAIDSALGQSYPNVEVIVVDDGSTDDSREIIENYGNRVTGVFKANGGQASAMNEGFSIARGELIYFLDSDDAALPECLERVVARYQAADNLPALLNFRLCLMNADGESLNQFSPPFDVSLPGNDVSTQLRQKGTFRHQATSANVFSAGSLKKVMPIPEKDFRICAETYLCYHAPLFGAVEAIEEVLANYRVHQNNNYHQPEKTYEFSEIVKYVAKQESFYAAIEKSRRRFAAEMNLEIGGNASLLHLIFKSANRKLSRFKTIKTGRFNNLQLAAESLREARQTDASASPKHRAAVMLYLAMIALLPAKMVCPLVRATFIRVPRSFDFLMKKSLSR